MAEILVLNGPNLNLLGRREPQHYGSSSLEAISAELTKIMAETGHTLSFFQSNAEHELVQRVHQALEQKAAFIVLNPAAFTHTSIALRDALAASAIPFIEVHLSNIHAREPFRHKSYFSDLARGVISGLGAQGYELALAAAIRYLKNQDNDRGHKKDQETH
ncbi:MAG: type II 3-dehydroquinate dehydratase [Acidiferrobacterales bacterium]